MARGIKGKVYKGVSETYLNRVKKNARHRGIPFTLTLRQIGNLFEKQEGCCIYTQLPLDPMIRQNDEFTASLDRKDPSKGYNIKNMQWVHKKVNFLKGGFTDAEFLNLVELIKNKK